MAATPSTFFAYLPRVAYQYVMQLGSQTEEYRSTPAPPLDQTALLVQDTVDPDIPGERRCNARTEEHLEVEGRKAAEEKQRYEKENKTLRKQLEGMGLEQAMMQREIDGLRERLHGYNATQQELQHTRKVAEEHHRSLSALQQQHHHTLALLDTRTSELQDAQKYLTKIDIISDADVLRLLKELNSLVFQLAAQIADSVLFHAMTTTEERGGCGYQAKDRAAELIGPRLVELLLGQQHDEDSICVQIAVQACIVTFMNRVINAWTFQNDGKYGFGAVYAALKMNESQTVAGRWRALSRLHLRLLSDRSTLSTDIENHLVRGITNVLLVSGADGAPEKLFDTMKSKFIDRIHAIIQLCLELQKAIGEDIISSDFEPLVARCGRSFDKERMDDAYSTDKMSRKPTSRSVNVLCTTEMGIQRVERRAEENGNTRIITLLKPKVVLETMIDELQATQGQASNVTREVEQ